MPRVSQWVYSEVMKQKEQKTQLLRVRLPAELHNWIKELAKVERRSANAETIILLELAKRLRMREADGEASSPARDPGHPQCREGSA